MGHRPAPTSKSRLVRGGALFGATILTAGLSLTTLPAAAGPTTVQASARKVATQEPGVTANLWEWNWKSIRSECSTLAKLGYDGVQVAPPQNSVKRTKLGDGSDTVLHPWWEVYQPVTYDLTSRMGTEAQFKAMVKTCRAEGVKVYVDAVINHMTGQGSTSYGGQNYTTAYTYPDAGYVPSDFHVPNGECSSSDGGIQDFNSLNQVFKCNLVGLQDLDTDQANVQKKLAAYLNKLLGYGVSGFRVDAGKHVGQDDLDDIYSRLNLTKDRKLPYWALEVFGGGPGVLSPQAFTKSGDVLGLDAAKQIQTAFKSYPAEHVGSIATLEVFGKGSGLTSSAKTMSFVTNHDTDRNASEYLGHKDGARYILANEWLLADGYGSPQVYSSFDWATTDASPPSTADGLITDTDCSSAAWTCDHRNPGIVGMIGWRHHVGKATRAHWWTDDANVIAFSKGSRGWAAFNNGSAAKEIRVQTGLRAGTYCDVISGKKSGGSCTGATVRVNRNGVTRVTVKALSAVAFTRTDRLS